MPVIAFGIDVCIQIIGIRYFRKLTLLNSLAMGFVIGLMSLGVLESWRFCTFFSVRENLSLMLADFTIYSALGYCYFHFINLGESARRIRILCELREAEDGLSYREILERYDAKQICGMRLGRLLSSGQVYHLQDRYYVDRPVVPWIAKVMSLLKTAVLGKKSPFD